MARAVHRRYCHRAVQTLAIALGREWADDWARRGHNLSKSQWARLREEAVRASSRDGLLKSLDDLERGLFKHGLSASKRAAQGEDDTPAKRIRNNLKGDVELKAALDSAGVPVRGAEGEDLVSRLALQACREAAIACARAKHKD